MKTTFSFAAILIAIFTFASAAPSANAQNRDKVKGIIGDIIKSKDRAITGTPSFWHLDGNANKINKLWMNDNGDLLVATSLDGFSKIGSYTRISDRLWRDHKGNKYSVASKNRLVWTNPSGLLITLTRVQ